MARTSIEQAIASTDRGLALEIQLKLPRGLHARPSARLAQLAQSFNCAISIIADNGEADAKSMLDVLSLALPFNARIILLAKGEDAADALEQLSDFLTRAKE